MQSQSSKTQVAPSLLPRNTLTCAWSRLAIRKIPSAADALGHIKAPLPLHGV